MLTHHIYGMDPALQRVQGFLISTHIREVVVKTRRDGEAKALARKADKEKGIPELLGYNINYLLRLSQVACARGPPPWRPKELARSPKRQHLTTVQRSLDDTARYLSIRTSIITMPGTLKITLALGF